MNSIEWISRLCELIYGCNKGTRKHLRPRLKINLMRKYSMRRLFYEFTWFRRWTYASMSETFTWHRSETIYSRDESINKFAEKLQITKRECSLHLCGHTIFALGQQRSGDRSDWSGIWHRSQRKRDSLFLIYSECDDATLLFFRPLLHLHCAACVAFWRENVSWNRFFANANSNHPFARNIPCYRAPQVSSFTDRRSIMEVTISIRDTIPGPHWSIFNDR